MLFFSFNNTSNCMTIFVLFFLSPPCLLHYFDVNKKSQWRAMIAPSLTHSVAYCMNQFRAQWQVLQTPCWCPGSFNSTETKKAFFARLWLCQELWTSCSFGRNTEKKVKRKKKSLWTPKRVECSGKKTVGLTALTAWPIVQESSDVTNN